MKVCYYCPSNVLLYRMMYWEEVGLNSTVEKASMDGSNHTTVLVLDNSNLATALALDVPKQVLYYWTHDYNRSYRYDHQLASASVNGDLRKVFNVFYSRYSTPLCMVYSDERLYYVVSSTLYLFDIQSEIGQALSFSPSLSSLSGMVLLRRESQEQGTNYTRGC